MKDKIRNFALNLGVDDVGVAAVADYKSAKSPPVEELMPGAKSIVVLAYKEPSSCESPNMQMAMAGRMEVMEFARTSNYRMVRFIEREGGGKAMSVGPSYPMEMSERTMGSIGELSLRHAAVSSGLAAFGRNNLALHPKYGSRIVYTAILTDLALDSDPALAENPCNGCNLCVESCPAKALDVEGRTDVGRCLRNSQPYGIGGAIKFWSRYADAAPDERKAMVKDTNFWKLYQAQMIGFQYFCWNCMKSCPVGQ